MILAGRLLFFPSFMDSNRTPYSPITIINRTFITFDNIKFHQHEDEVDDHFNQDQDDYIDLPRDPCQHFSQWVTKDTWKGTTSKNEKRIHFRIQVLNTTHLTLKIQFWFAACLYYMKDIKRRLIVDSTQATEFLLLNRDIWGGGGGRFFKFYARCSDCSILSQIMPE